MHEYRVNKIYKSIVGETSNKTRMRVKKELEPYQISSLDIPFFFLAIIWLLERFFTMTILQVCTTYSDSHPFSFCALELLRKHVSPQDPYIKSVYLEASI